MTEINLRYEALLAKRPELVEYAKIYWTTAFSQVGVWQEAGRTIKPILEAEGIRPEKYDKGRMHTEFDDIMNYIATNHGWRQR